MHPAGSIILFTTASGLGYGLLFITGIYAALVPNSPSPTFGLAALGIALGTVTLGLLSSTFHLGHPERAWRAVSQWRSSWLSREGVLALVTYVPAAYFAIGWVFLDTDIGAWRTSGILSALLAILTVISTSMIYASIKSIPRWHNCWVPATYLLFALLSGLLWFDALLRLFGHTQQNITLLATGCVVVALLAKWAYWRKTDNDAPVATIGTATGLGAKVTMLEPPHTGENYLLKEMGFQIARKHAVKLRRAAIFLTFLIPFCLCVLTLLTSGTTATFSAILAAIIAQTGIVVERWLFFAEAQHVMSLYYGRELGNEAS